MVDSTPLDTNAGVSRAAFLAAFAFALLSSTSLVFERLGQGRSTLGWLCSIVVTAGALLLVVNRESPRSRRPVVVLLSHVLGSLLAISVVHLVALAISTGRLIERPAQLVNDAVLVVTTLGFVWSIVSRVPVIRTISPLLSYGVLGVYAATMRNWHLDPLPGTTVQRYVIGQVVVTSAVLLLYYFISPEPAREV